MIQSVSIPIYSPGAVSRTVSTSKIRVVNIHKKGQFVYQEGDLAKKYYFLKEGILVMGVQSEKGKNTFTHLIFEGEYFGEEVLMNIHFRSSFGMVLSSQASIEECSINDSTYTKIEVLTQVFQTKMERCKQTLLRNNTMNLKERIISTLVTIAKGAGVGLLNGDHLIRTHIKHRELALLTSATRQSVTTALLELVNLGLIVVDRNSLLISNQLMVNSNKLEYYNQ